MLHFFVRVLVTALAVLVASWIVPGLRVRGFWSAVVFALVLGLVAKLLFGVLVVLSLPLVVISFGLFLLVINGLLFWLAGKFVGGVEVSGFFSAFLASLVVAIVTTVTYHYSYVLRSHAHSWSSSSSWSTTASTTSTTSTSSSTSSTSSSSTSFTSLLLE